MRLPADARLLQFQEQSTQITRRPAAQIAAESGPGDGLEWQRLPIARAALAAALRRDPPTPLAIEQAIEQVEEAILPPRALAAGAQALWLADGAAYALARHAGLPADEGGAIALDADAVEALFNRLAARAGGRPAAQDALPTDPTSSATLVLLREALHHWGLRRIVVAPAGAFDWS